MSGGYLSGGNCPGGNCPGGNCPDTGRSNMADKQNVSEFLRFQSQIISKWGELPKLYLFLVKLMVQAYIIFKIAVLHSHVAKKNGRFNKAEKRKASIFLHFQTQTISKWGELPKFCLFLVKIGLQDSTIFKMALLYSLVAIKNGGFNMADTTAACIFGSS